MFENFATEVKRSYTEIQELYERDSIPWIIGFSGGKDSTATLQLIYLALKALPSKNYHKNIYVVSSDTLVEIPSVVERFSTTLGKLEKQAQKDDLPFKTQKVSPEVDNSFFVNIIGRGYPAPTRNFRWCTERLKITPTSKFIEDVVSESGHAIVILGSRKKESMSRAQSLLNHQIKGTILKRHTSLANAYVYTPIEEWDVEEVWGFLTFNESPWGDDNEALVTMYRKAGGDECPLVIDTSTPSCGNSRFGCWTCTVVKQDKSIKGFIYNGDTWLQPMADYRDLLAEWRESRGCVECLSIGKIDNKKCKTCKGTGNDENGNISRREVKLENRGNFGPFTVESRLELLERLFVVEKLVKDEYGRRLINSEELYAIQHIWELDGRFKESVSDIYNRVNKIELKTKDIRIEKRDDKEEHELSRLCNKLDVSNDLLQRLLFLEEDLSKMRRRKGVYERIDFEINQFLDRSIN